MKLGISEKDKKLLIMLSIFVIVVGIGYWGIYPNIKSIKKMNKEIEKEQSKKEENELKVAMLPELKKANEEGQVVVSEDKEVFFPMMTSDMVDKYLTNMALGYSLYAYNLDIAMPKEEAYLDPYVLSEKAFELNGMKQKDLEKEKKEKAQIKTGIYDVQVSFKVGGDEKVLIKFIDDLANSENKLRISKYSWQNERNVSYEEDGSYDISVKKVLNITLDLYMCEE